MDGKKYPASIKKASDHVQSVISTIAAQVETHAKAATDKDEKKALEGFHARLKKSHAALEAKA